MKNLIFSFLLFSYALSILQCSSKNNPLETFSSTVQNSTSHYSKVSKLLRSSPLSDTTLLNDIVDSMQYSNSKLYDYLFLANSYEYSQINLQEPVKIHKSIVDTILLEDELRIPPKAAENFLTNILNLKNTNPDNPFTKIFQDTTTIKLENITNEKNISILTMRKIILKTNDVISRKQISFRKKKLKSSLQMIALNNITKNNKTLAYDAIFIFGVQDISIPIRRKPSCDIEEEIVFNSLYNKCGLSIITSSDERNAYNWISKRLNRHFRPVSSVTCNGENNLLIYYTPPFVQHFYAYPGFIKPNAYGSQYSLMTRKIIYPPTGTAGPPQCVGGTCCFNPTNFNHKQEIRYYLNEANRIASEERPLPGYQPMAFSMGEGFNTSGNIAHYTLSVSYARIIQLIND